ncbi:MAG: hypothetical protein PGN13_09255 [Patulibacter minatonensis]
MTTLRSLALVAVAAGAVGFAGCGDSDGGTASGGSSTDAKTLLVNTFQPSGEGSKIKSGTVEIKLSGKMTGAKPLDGAATAKISIDQGKNGELPNFKADVSVDGQQKGGQKFELDAGGTYVGNRFYVSYDGDNYDVGEELSRRAVASMKQAVKESGSDDDQKQIVAKLGLNPQTWLTNPKVDGDEQIGGVDTYKITGSVDLKALVPDILDAARKAQSLAGPAAGSTKVPTVTDAQLDAVAKQIKKLDVTVWTGKDDQILRQLKVDAQIDDTDSNDSLEGSLQLTLTDVNEKQEITAPSDTKPITDLMPKLGGLFGAASGLGNGGASGANSLGAGSSVPDSHVQCVNAAGGDAAKLNACQSELQK